MGCRYLFKVSAYHSATRQAVVAPLYKILYSRRWVTSWVEGFYKQCSVVVRCTTTSHTQRNVQYRNAGQVVSLCRENTAHQPLQVCAVHTRPGLLASTRGPQPTARCKVTTAQRKSIKYSDSGCFLVLTVSLFATVVGASGSLWLAGSIIAGSVAPALSCTGMVVGAGYHFP